MVNKLFHLNVAPLEIKVNSILYPNSVNLQGLWGKSTRLYINNTYRKNMLFFLIDARDSNWC